MSLARLFRRRPQVPFARWGWDVREFHLPKDGRVKYAQWLHPAETTKVVSQADVDGLRTWIQPGDFAIDIGAHTGDTTVPMAVAAGLEGCVLALEPNRYVFEVLEQNAALNPDQTNVVPRCYAATPEDGQFEFLYGDASFCNGGASLGRWSPLRRKYPLAVDGRNLLRVLRDEFADRLPRLSYVKVDAEGHDRSILESILPILKKFRPVVRTEVYRKLRADERRALYDLLAAADYDLYRFEGGAEPQGEMLPRTALMSAKHFDMIAVPAAAAVAQRAA